MPLSPLTNDRRRGWPRHLLGDMLWEFAVDSQGLPKSASLWTWGWRSFSRLRNDPDLLWVLVLQRLWHALTCGPPASEPREERGEEAQQLQGTPAALSRQQSAAGTEGWQTPRTPRSVGHSSAGTSSTRLRLRRAKSLLRASESGDSGEPQPRERSRPKKGASSPLVLDVTVTPRKKAPASPGGAGDASVRGGAEGQQLLGAASAPRGTLASLRRGGAASAAATPGGRSMRSFASESSLGALSFIARRPAARDASVPHLVGLSGGRVGLRRGDASTRPGAAPSATDGASASVQGGSPLADRLRLPQGNTLSMLINFTPKSAGGSSNLRAGTSFRKPQLQFGEGGSPSVRGSVMRMRADGSVRPNDAGGSVRPHLQYSRRALDARGPGAEDASIVRVPLLRGRMSLIISGEPSSSTTAGGFFKGTPGGNGSVRPPPRAAASARGGLRLGSPRLSALERPSALKALRQQGQQAASRSSGTDAPPSPAGAASTSRAAAIAPPRKAASSMAAISRRKGAASAAIGSSSPAGAPLAQGAPAPDLGGDSSVKGGRRKSLGDAPASDGQAAATEEERSQAGAAEAQGAAAPGGPSHPASSSASRGGAALPLVRGPPPALSTGLRRQNSADALRASTPFGRSLRSPPPAPSSGLRRQGSGGDGPAIRRTVSFFARSDSGVGASAATADAADADPCAPSSAAVQSEGGASGKQEAGADGAVGVSRRGLLVRSKSEHMTQPGLSKSVSFVGREAAPRAAAAADDGSGIHAATAAGSAASSTPTRSSFRRRTMSLPKEVDIDAARAEATSSPSANPGRTQRVASVRSLASAIDSMAVSGGSGRGARSLSLAAAVSSTSRKGGGEWFAPPPPPLLLPAPPPRASHSMRLQPRSPSPADALSPTFLRKRGSESALPANRSPAGLTRDSAESLLQRGSQPPLRRARSQHQSERALSSLDESLRGENDADARPGGGGLVVRMAKSASRAELSFRRRDGTGAAVDGARSGADSSRRDGAADGALALVVRHATRRGSDGAPGGSQRRLPQLASLPSSHALGTRAPTPSAPRRGARRRRAAHISAGETPERIEEVYSANMAAAELQRKLRLFGLALLVVMWVVLPWCEEGKAFRRRFASAALTVQAQSRRAHGMAESESARLAASLTPPFHPPVGTRFAFSYGLLVADLMGEKEAASFTMSFAVGVAFDSIGQGQELLQEALNVTVAFLLLERLRLVPWLWFERWVDHVRCAASGGGLGFPLALFVLRCFFKSNQLSPHAYLFLLSAQHPSDNHPPEQDHLCGQAERGAPVSQARSNLSPHPRHLVHLSIYSLDQNLFEPCIELLLCAIQLAQILQQKLFFSLRY